MIHKKILISIFIIVTLFLIREPYIKFNATLYEEKNSSLYHAKVFDTHSNWWLDYVPIMSSREATNFRFVQLYDIKTNQLIGESGICSFFDQLEMEYYFPQGTKNDNLFFYGVEPKWENGKYEIEKYSYPEETCFVELD